MSISKTAPWPVLAASIVLLLIGCGEDPAAPLGTTDGSKAAGTLNIVFNATGPDADYNGVVFEIKAYPSGQMTTQRVHQAGEYAFALPSGRYEVSIKDVMWNCDMPTPALQRVHVFAGQLTEADFEVCWAPILPKFDSYVGDLADEGLVQPNLCQQLHGMCVTSQQLRDDDMDWVAAALIFEQMRHVASLSGNKLSEPVAIELVNRMATVRNHYLEIEQPDIHMH